MKGGEKMDKDSLESGNLASETLKSAGLVRRFQAGDGQAFAELYELYKTGALRSAYLICGNMCDSENVLQESFLKCYQQLEGLREPAAFRSWFYRILTRTAWEYCRKRDKECPVEDVFDAYQAVSETGHSSLEWLVQAEESRLLLACINDLPLKQKMVVILYYYDEMSVQEIAEATGALPGTVKSRLFVARHNLQKALLAADKFSEESVAQSIPKSMQKSVSKYMPKSVPKIAAESTKKFDRTQKEEERNELQSQS
jgi:RNA polymerase sigma-70 factor (ECF subfamily)